MYEKASTDWRARGQATPSGTRGGTPERDLGSEAHKKTRVWAQNPGSWTVLLI